MRFQLVALKFQLVVFHGFILRVNSQPLLLLLLLIPEKMTFIRRDKIPLNNLLQII